MGLGTVRPILHLAWGVALCVVGVGLIWVFDLVSKRYFDVQDTEFVRMLLPQTRREKAWFCVLSVFAGVGEEIAFRGFLLTAIELWSGSVVLALFVSSIAFGVVHAYQARAGMLRAGMLGMLLGGSLLVTGSLVPAIVAHTLIDWVMGLWLGPLFVRSEPDPVAPETIAPETIDPEPELT
jgi:membrane protease YdiL (CAAX protease family)